MEYTGSYPSWSEYMRNPEEDSVLENSHLFLCCNTTIHRLKNVPTFEENIKPTRQVARSNQITCAFPSEDTVVPLCLVGRCIPDGNRHDATRTGIIMELHE